MRRTPLTTDIGLAVLAAILVLIIAPGAAVAGLIALVVLIFCAASVVRQSRARRARPGVRTRRDPPRGS
jgi:hypothetical protein